MSMEFKLRKKLIDLAIKYQGNYQDIQIALSCGDVEKDSSLLSISSATLAIGDEEYPQCFLQLIEPPLVLFCYGNKHLLNRGNKIGVVGTRKPTILGKRAVDGPLAYTFRHYKEKGEQLILVNGMARGIDLLAARIAMKYDMPLIMYLGSGIDKIYPLEASDIYEYCKRGSGLILSEYPNLVEPKRSNFPFRNRLIAATSTFYSSQKPIFLQGLIRL